MILTLARRGLLAHKRRLVGLCTAIALGVAFLTGTLVLGDTMRSSFDEVFSTANAGIDVVVQGTTDLESIDGAPQRVYVSDALVAELEAAEGVQFVQPMAEGLAQIIAPDGTAIGGGGPPTLGGNWVDDTDLTPLSIVQGRAPASTGEVVIDAASATEGGISVGDRIRVLAPEPIPVEVVGLTKYGDSGSFAGASFVGFTFEQAAEVLVPRGELTSIIVQGDGISPDELAERVRPMLPANAEALTGEELTEQQNERVQSEFLIFFQTFLTVFAVIALIVSTFSIYNTFSVIAAQKSRESALLRAVGATRSQVLGSLAGESFLIGMLAAAMGVGLGIGVAAGLNALFAALGVALPNAGLAVTPSSLVIGFVVGVIVALVAALFPAFRASRVPPLAALRDVAVETPPNLKRRAVIGGGLLVIGVVALGSLAFTEGNELPRVAIGSAATFVGFLVFGPVAAPRIAKIVGAPIARFRGVSGRMALANATRNPKRTASTAAALLVGVAVVSMFTIFASSMKNAITESFVGDLEAELSMSNTNFSGSGFDPKMIEDIRALRDVAAVSAFDNTNFYIDGQSTTVTVVDVPDFQATTFLGDDVTLQPNALSVDSELAAELDVTAGDSVTLGFASGETAAVEVETIYQKNNLLSGFVVPRPALASYDQNTPILTTFIKLKPGVPEESGQETVQRIADQYDAGEVQTREQFADAAAGQIDQLLAIIYALLLLAIIIALMGIANTLSLSVFERTRELGLLRAVGQTRPQTRGMVRWESVIIAMFGTVGGIGLGVILGWALFAAVATAAGFPPTLSVSVAGLALIAVVGSGVGVLAGLRPAARAAKLNVLAAIASE